MPIPMNRAAQVHSLRQKIGQLVAMPGDTPVFVTISDQGGGMGLDPTVEVTSDRSAVYVSMLVDELYGTGREVTLRELRRRVGVPPVAPILGQDATTPTPRRASVAEIMVGVASVLLIGGVLVWGIAGRVHR